MGWAKIKEMQAATPLPNVSLIERVPDTQLESFLSAADIWIIPYRRNNTGVSVPSRIYNLLAVGRPVIICSEPDAEAALLVREEEIGWVVPPENADAIAKAISRLLPHRLPPGERPSRDRGRIPLHWADRVQSLPQSDE